MIKSDHVLTDDRPPRQFFFKSTHFSEVFDIESVPARVIPRLERELSTLLILKSSAANERGLEDCVHAHQRRLLDVHLLKQLVALQFFRGIVDSSRHAQI